MIREKEVWYRQNAILLSYIYLKKKKKKKDEVLSFATMWMNLESIMQNE